MELKLKEKHIFVTGASGGIGKHIVRMLLEENATVTLQVFQNEDKANRSLTEFIDSHNFHVVKGDLRSEEDVRRMFESSLSKFGRIDGLVANAGVWPNVSKLSSEMSTEQWKNTLNVNLTGVFLCVKEFFKNLIKYPKNHASLVLIGSTAGKFGEAGHADYSATKSALMFGLTKTWKNEIIRYAPLGRVNTIAPGWTYTEMAEDALADENEVKKILQTIPLKKIALPEDISSAVLFLLSDKVAGHITGTTLMIDGGMEGRRLFDKDEISLEFLKDIGERNF